MSCKLPLPPSPAISTTNPQLPLTSRRPIDIHKRPSRTPTLRPHVRRRSSDRHGRDRRRCFGSLPSQERRWLQLSAGETLTPRGLDGSPSEGWTSPSMCCIQWLLSHSIDEHTIPDISVRAHQDHDQEEETDLPSPAPCVSQFSRGAMYNHQLQGRPQRDRAERNKLGMCGDKDLLRQFVQTA